MLRLGMTRGVLPNVKAGVSEKAARLNHCASLSALLPSRLASLPFQVGRCDGLKRPTVFAPWLIMIGTPLWKVAMPLNCQPPITQFATGCQSLPNRLQGQRGRWKKRLLRRGGGLSCEPIARSAARLYASWRALDCPRKLTVVETSSISLLQV